jgi:hypothetical protein
MWLYVFCGQYPIENIKHFKILFPIKLFSFKYKEYLLYFLRPSMGLYASFLASGVRLVYSAWQNIL